MQSLLGFPTSQDPYLPACHCQCVRGCCAPALPPGIPTVLVVGIWGRSAVGGRKVECSSPMGEAFSHL